VSSIRTAIFKHLSQSAGVHDLVGDRIFPHTARQGTAFPYITFQLIADPAEDHMGGPSAIAHPTFQIDCWAESSTDAENVFEAVRDAFEGFRGSIEGVKISRVFRDAGFSDFEQVTEGRENEIFRNSMDVIIWYRREVPTFT